ncbi:hypothetical protein B0H19DRAFT_1243916 [Mycena capillaripes]|nr:hypothetical protein B0H19DRAFT_1243916 [Mycena capillaripes]
MTTTAPASSSPTTTLIPPDEDRHIPQYISWAFAGAQRSRTAIDEERLGHASCHRDLQLRRRGAIKMSNSISPSTKDFPKIGCTDEEALEALGSTMAWLSRGSQNERADHLNFASTTWSSVCIRSSDSGLKKRKRGRPKSSGLTRTNKTRGWVKRDGMQTTEEGLANVGQYLHTVGGTLVVIAEFEDYTIANDHAAQLFAEMIGSIQIGKKISRGSVFAIGAISRMDRLNCTVDVINYLFSVCLDAFRDHVRLSQDPHGKDRVVDVSTRTYDLICQAQAKLQYPTDMKFSIEVINTRGAEGLAFLQEGLEALPRLENFPSSKNQEGLVTFIDTASTTDEGPQNYAELAALVDKASERDEPKLISDWQYERRRA